MALTIAMFFLVVLCSPLAWCAQGDANTLVEVEALTSFKINLHDPLGVLDGWNSSTPSAPCDWPGVACEDNIVTELSLPGLQLGGQLSDRLGDLGKLRDVFLHNNSLSGHLPPEIGNLTSLQILNLRQNYLSGNISGELPPNLKYLDLSCNSFSGEIPWSITNLSHLQFINFSYNQFSGQIPAIMRISTLRTVDLSNNLFSGIVPGEIGNLSRLEERNVASNSFRGRFLRVIEQNETLHVVIVEGNHCSFDDLKPWLIALVALAAVSPAVLVCALLVQICGVCCPDD